jgi:hypothetical protein
VSDFLTRAPHLAARLSEELDADLQDRMADAGWEHTVKLSAKEGLISLSYSSSQETNIFESEYGSENRSPNSVVRPFIDNAQKNIESSIGQEAIDFLFAEGILP